MDKVVKFMEKNLSVDTTGHGIDHALRVRNMALRIWEEEGGNKRVIETAAIAHNIIDSKLFDNADVQRRKLKDFLDKSGYEEEEVNQIMDLVDLLNYSTDYINVPLTIEGKILQDAERIDAMGALGIARTFTAGGAKYKKFFKSENKNVPVDEVSLISYTNGRTDNTTINYFYDYLLKLKDLMNTESGKNIAVHRTNFMENFLNEFFDEWEGIK